MIRHTYVGAILLGSSLCLPSLLTADPIRSTDIGSGGIDPYEQGVEGTLLKGSPMDDDDRPPIDPRLRRSDRIAEELVRQRKNRSARGAAGSPTSSVDAGSAAGSAAGSGAGSTAESTAGGANPASSPSPVSPALVRPRSDVPESSKF